MDINELIRNAVMNNTTAWTPNRTLAPAPTIDIGSPLINEDLLRGTMSKALTPEFGNTDSDINTALGKIGMALMQPRMPGESVSGNIGKAMGQGVDFLEASKLRNQQQALAQGQIASSMSNADVQRRTAEMALKKFSVTWPEEWKKVQLEIKQLQDRGDVVARDALVARVMSDPQMVAEEISTKLRGEAAKVKKTEEETKGLSSTAKYHEAAAKRAEAEADWISRGGKDRLPPGTKQLLHTTKLDDGSIFESVGIVGPDGKNETYSKITVPGLRDPGAARKLAEAQLNSELKAAGKTSIIPFIGQKPTETEIQKRTKELMSDQVRWVGASPGGTPSNGNETLPPVTPAETDAEALKIVQQATAEGRPQAARVTTPMSATAPAPVALKPGQVRLPNGQVVNMPTASGQKPTPVEPVTDEAQRRVREALSNLRARMESETTSPETKRVLQAKIDKLEKQLKPE